MIDIKAVERLINYTFNQPSLLVQAFTRKSYTVENGGDQSCCNEVLEFLGDAVLGCVLTDIIVMERSSMEGGVLTAGDSEGTLSQIKSGYVRKDNLANIIENCGLEKYILMGAGDISQGIRHNKSVKEDLFESIVGAVFLDCNKEYGIVREVVAKLMEQGGFSPDTHKIKDEKTQLQELCAKSGKSVSYIDAGSSGRPHERIFERKVLIDGKEAAAGSGASKKEADMQAAAKALSVLQKKRK